MKVFRRIIFFLVLMCIFCGCQSNGNETKTPTITGTFNFTVLKAGQADAMLSKPEYKEKLRLRSYGIPDSDSEVFLEIKKKFNGIVNKRRTKLKLSEAYQFIESGKAPEPKEYMNKQVIRELEYFLKIYDLSPKLYLAYDRIAYFEKDNKDLRISFDMNIRSRRYDLALEKGDHGEMKPSICFFGNVWYNI